MDELAIADRRILRRKLSFWRWVTALLLLIAGFTLFAFSGLGEVRERARDHVAPGGLRSIQDAAEPVHRLARTMPPTSA